MSIYFYVITVDVHEIEIFFKVFSTNNNHVLIIHILTIHNRKTENNGGTSTFPEFPGEKLKNIL